MTEIVVFDTNFLSVFTDSASPAKFTPDDSEDSLQDRFDFLIEKLSANGTEIVIPSPVLGEVLCASNVNSGSVLRLISTSPIFRVVPYSQREAIEFAYMFRSSHKGAENRAAFRFDLLILATAKVLNASTIYTADEGLARKATTHKIKPISFQNLQRRPPKLQKSLDLFSSQVH